MSAAFSKNESQAIPIDVVSVERLERYRLQLGKPHQKWMKDTGFAAKLGKVCILPKDDGGIARVVAGWGDAKMRARGRLHMASVAKALPEGDYCLASGLAEEDLEESVLAWLMSAYAFDKYKEKLQSTARLVVPKAIDADRLKAIIAGEFLTRDLINTPASNMGPDDLEAAFKALGKRHGADVEVVKGDDLLKHNFPMIHAVGRASGQEPRLLDMRWGEPTAPLVTLVGKGVCFDTGGLNIKPGASMGLMKKDMGGAANALGLAHMIMELNLPVRLRVLVPAVENSISAGAFRPQDILTSRKGLTVEVNNTDAEGRLVLADALALADEETPDLLICQATLTGAARVAMGPDVPPFFTDNDDLADEISAASKSEFDPLWRLPFWDPYESMIEPDIADLDNAPKGGFAGSVTAALFLRRFVENTSGFVHLDLYGWTPVAKPGRSLGGACQSARALLRVIENRVFR